MPDLFFDICGILGVVFYIGCYGALQFGLLRGSSLAYTIGNLLASSLVLVSLTRDWNQASAVVNAIWIAISLVGLTRIYLGYRRLRFTPEEEAMRRAVLAEMPKPMARVVLDAGDWTDLEEGHGLTFEGAAGRDAHLPRARPGAGPLWRAVCRPRGARLCRRDQRHGRAAGDRNGDHRRPGARLLCWPVRGCAP